MQNTVCAQTTNITYTSFQGACILNMLREYLSADAFKSGIVQYLQKYSYKNTKNEDLWNSMASVSMFSISVQLRLTVLLSFCFCYVLLPLRSITDISYSSESDVLICGFRFAQQMMLKPGRAFVPEASIHLPPQ